METYIEMRKLVKLERWAEKRLIRGICNVITGDYCFKFSLFHFGAFK